MCFAFTMMCFCLPAHPSPHTHTHTQLTRLLGKRLKFRKCRLDSNWLTRKPSKCATISRASIFCATPIPPPPTIANFFYTTLKFRSSRWSSRRGGVLEKLQVHLEMKSKIRIDDSWEKGNAKVGKWLLYITNGDEVQGQVVANEWGEDGIIIKRKLIDR